MLLIFENKTAIVLVLNLLDPDNKKRRSYKSNNLNFNEFLNMSWQYRCEILFHTCFSFCLLIDFRLQTKVCD